MDENLKVFLSLLREFGPLIAAIGFFIWRDWKREDRMTKRITDLEKQNIETILPLVTECTAVISRNTAVMERLETAMAIAAYRYPSNSMHTEEG
jgi:hypothetical protein